MKATPQQRSFVKAVTSLRNEIDALSLEIARMESMADNYLDRPWAGACGELDGLLDALVDMKAEREHFQKLHRDFTASDYPLNRNA